MAPERAQVPKMEKLWCKVVRMRSQRKQRDSATTGATSRADREPEPDFTCSRAGEQRSGKPRAEAGRDIQSGQPTRCRNVKVTELDFQEVVASKYPSWISIGS